MGTHPIFESDFDCLTVQIMNKFVTLNNGTKMPRLGLGTWKAPKAKTKAAVKTAIKAGYRLIDCANDYDNEHVIGEALQELFSEGVVKREELFIQAKLWNSNHRPEHVKLDLEATLKDLQVSYVDSFVIHWPQAVPSNGKYCALRPGGCYADHESKQTMFPLDDEGYYCADMESHYLETWKVMEALVDEGLCKSIGLSNFNKRQIEEVYSNAQKYKPAVLQNESHPYMQEKDLRDFCKLHNIVFQAYSSLGSADRPWRQSGSITSGPPKVGHEVLQHPEIMRIGKKYNKSAAQAVLRWHVQNGGTCVAKSVTPSRIEENYQIWDFELDADDMAKFGELNVGWRHLVWAETSMHPDYPFKDDIPYGYVLGKPAPSTTAGKQ